MPVTPAVRWWTAKPCGWQAEMAGQGKKAALRLCAWLLALAACLGGCAWLTGRASAAVPEGVQMCAAAGVGETLASVEQHLPGAGGAVWQQSALEDGTPVWAVAATAGYGQAAGVRLTQGGWFGPDAVGEAARWAVVPDTLGAGSASGALLRLGERYYTVCGVYRSASDVFARAATDGRPVLYLSAPVEGEAETLQAQQLVAVASRPGQRAASVAAQAGEALPGLHGTWRDLASLRALPGTLLRLGAALGLALPVFWLLAASWRRMVRLYDGALAGLPARRMAAQGASAAVLAAAGAGAAGCLVRWIGPPAAYLPTDNLFDWAHYANLAAAFFQRINGASFPDPLARIGAAYALGAFFLALLLAVCLHGVFAAGRALLQARPHKG